MHLGTLFGTALLVLVATLALGVGLREPAGGYAAPTTVTWVVAGALALLGAGVVGRQAVQDAVRRRHAEAPLPPPLQRRLALLGCAAALVLGGALLVTGLLSVVALQAILGAEVLTFAAGGIALLRPAELRT